MRALVTGAGGFIGGHLVKRLLADGWEVIATDIKHLSQWWQVHDCDNFDEVDLRKPLGVLADGYSAVFHMAARMGGIGEISDPLKQVEILHDNTVMTLNVLDWVVSWATAKFFFPSSVCVYPPDVTRADHLITEEDAGDLFGLRDSYSQSKLYLEQAVQYYGVEMKVYVARFQNVMGPMGDWTGGKEKAPAALCRKVAEAKLAHEDYKEMGDTSPPYYPVEIWGDGEQVRSPMYVDDCVEGILRLIETDYHKPVNLGPDEHLTINELVDIIAETAGIPVTKTHIDGPEGSRARLFDHSLLREVLGWVPETNVRKGIGELYPWVEEQVNEAS